MERLYGRADLLERTRVAVAEAGSGSGRLLLFTGEPGIGKSRLAEQVAAEAQAHGARVAWGRSWEAGGAPAYWPWIQVFRDLQIEDDPFVAAAAELGPGATEARFAAFDRAVQALKLAALRRPLALVLDDLHAADAPSLLLLLLLARELQRAPILVIGAYRDAESRGNRALAPLLAKLAREGEVLPLDRLSPEAVAAWARDASAAFDPARSDELYEVTEGHPLYVVEVLRLGARAGGSAALPAGPGVLDERLGDISAGTRSVLAVAAVLGREFDASELAAVTGSSLDHVVAASREALAASILVRGRDAEVFRFSHVLLRDRLYGELAPSARAALHYRAGTLGLARGAAPHAVVHHLFEGWSAGEPHTIVRIALAAAEAERARLAFEDAARIGRHALSLAGGPQLPARVPIELRLVVAESLIRLGDGAEGKALCVQAVDLAEQAGADDLVARAALVYGTELASGTVDPQMIALLRRALARLADERSPLCARLMARLAAALTPPLSPEQGPEILALMRSATQLARSLGDRDALLYVLQFGAAVALLTPELERFSMMTEAVELAKRLDRRLALLSTLPAYVTALLARGERERAEAELPAYDALLVAFRQPLHRLRRLLVGSLMSALRGEFDDAERASREAHELVRPSREGPELLLWLTHRLSLAQLRARPDLAVREAPQLLAHFDAMPSALPYSTWLLVGLGRHAEAAERLRRAPLEPQVIAAANLMELMGAAETCVLLGERALGHALYPRLERASTHTLWNLGPGALLGPTARVLGDLACFIGRPADAVRHYDAGIAFAERLGAPPLLELCRHGRELALGARHSGQPPREPRELSGVHEASGPHEAGTAHEAGEPGAPSEAALNEGLAALRPALSKGLRLELRREGELWALVHPAGAAVRLRHSKGLDYLRQLLERPGRQVHVLELAGIEHQTGDAGVLLDERAKAEYKRRLDDLREALREAEAFADTSRAGRIRAELDALAEQLARAVGMGGRDRRAASDVERMRVNVQRRLKDALDRIAAADPAVGRYLAATVKTGTYCVYDPL